MSGTDITNAKLTYRERNEGDFPPQLHIILEKEWDLKYGENPNQHAAIYFLANARKIAELTNLQSVRSDGKGKGGLSLTNTMDITRAMDNLKFFRDTPVAVVMKHNIVSGFAKQTNGQSQVELYRLARDADRRSSHGGTIAFTQPLGMETANALFELYDQGHIIDVVAAPDYDEGVIGRIEKGSKNVRIGQFSSLDKLPRFPGDETYGLLSIKEMPTGRFGVQDIYLTSIKGPEQLITDPFVVDKQATKHAIETTPTSAQLDDLLTSWWLNVAGARSNGIVLVRNGVSVAVGSGQVERVGAVEQCIVKALQKAMDREGIRYDPLMGITGHEQLRDNPLIGAAASSDAFFPFPDSVGLLGRMGIGSIIQPCGSVHDGEVIDEANKWKIPMVATLERCFGHF